MSISSENSSHKYVKYDSLILKQTEITLLKKRKMKTVFYNVKQSF